MLIIINHNNNQTDANNINRFPPTTSQQKLLQPPTEPQAGHLSKPSGSPPSPTRRLPPEPVALEGRRLAPTFLSRLNYIPKKAFPGR